MHARLTALTLGRPDTRSELATRRNARHPVFPAIPDFQMHRSPESHRVLPHHFRQRAHQIGQPSAYLSRGRTLLSWFNSPILRHVARAIHRHYERRITVNINENSQQICLWRIARLSPRLKDLASFSDHLPLLRQGEYACYIFFANPTAAHLVLCMVTEAILDDLPFAHHVMILQIVRPRCQRQVPKDSGAAAPLCPRTSIETISIDKAGSHDSPVAL